jgi:hypothetical protein
VKGNYRQLNESIRSRINPDNIILEKSLRDDLSTVSYSEVLQYVRLAMKGVDPAYSQASKDAGAAVKKHLQGLIPHISFEYQGSVMTNTHIKAHSDIDLLVLTERSYQYDRNATAWQLNENASNWTAHPTLRKKLELQQAAPNYAGDTTNDLLSIRLASEAILQRVYNRCDITGAKAICVTNLNYNREVDVVIANWYDDVISIINDKGIQRGVQIYNKDLHTRENPDYPFISLARINERGNATNGRLRRMIRFLKNVKSDSDNDIQLSSFHIASLCYNIPVASYQYASYTSLVRILYQELLKITSDAAYAYSITSVNGREYPFRQATVIAQLQLLLNEVTRISIDIPDSSPL